MIKKIKILSFVVALVTMCSSYPVYARDIDINQRQEISVELSSQEKKEVFLEQKEIVEKIKKEDPNSNDFAEKIDKIVDKDYNTINQAVENKAERQDIPLKYVSEIETNVGDRTYNIDK